MNIIRRHYFVLILLALLFAAPGLSAIVFYYHPQWLGSTQINKGTLLNPPILLTHRFEHSKWRVLLWSPEACDTDCVQLLDQLARVRLALGRRLYEVESFLLLGIHAPPLSKMLVEMLHDSDIHVLKLNESDLEKMRILSRAPQVYLMNPKGFLVLSYEITAKPDDVFHDLKRLLNARGS